MIVSEYKKKPIRFDEAREVWVCDEYALNAPSLRALKVAMDKAEKEHRRIKLPAIHVDEPWRGPRRIVDVTIELVTANGRSARVRRAGKSEQVDLSSLYPLTARPVIEQWVAARIEADKASEIVDRLYERAREHQFDYASLQAAIEESLRFPAKDKEVGNG